MKIPETYEKLEEFIYNPKKKTFRRKRHTWYLKECHKQDGCGYNELKCLG